MSWKAWTKEGKLKQETADISTVESQQRSAEDLLEMLLAEVKKLKKGLSLSLGVDLDDVHEEE